MWLSFLCVEGVPLSLTHTLKHLKSGLEVVGRQIKAHGQCMQQVHSSRIKQFAVFSCCVGLRGEGGRCLVKESDEGI